MKCSKKILTLLMASSLMVGQTQAISADTFKKNITAIRTLTGIALSALVVYNEYSKTQDEIGPRLEMIRTALSSLAELTAFIKLCV